MMLLQRRMRILILLVWLDVLQGFSVPPPSFLTSSSFHRRTKSDVIVLENQRWRQDIEENSRRKAQGNGAGETVAGAILGGLLGGPFGAVFGASVGSSFGSQNAVNRSRQEEMKRMGLSQDMLDSAEQVGLALEQCMQGLQQVQESLDTQQRLARRLDADADSLYEKAKTCMANNNEEEAKKYLLERERVRDRLKDVLGNCVTAKQQVRRNRHHHHKSVNPTLT